ncbi:hypothetical protein ACWESJ_12455 [Staphylococcus xylosus]|uniref:Uncharacterized protein n=1 Tax=Staphylococcus gallinarum TaxID=1293 RepID=A0A418HKU6_STAGA|nr:hypothetical protein [Staphylococcus gallinarum]MCD8822448.1 hypothetical protein [Staphylococcus gallinarum]MCD8872571.1 hypothetical protein [Staphylococcus gallinarum]RIL40943.1 hypothetical protein BUZ01_13855 [Staphylococcus gallinarum]RIO88831.1 hypothetical protein BUZ04_13085 [Staphylococcus gallinarum]
MITTLLVLMIVNFLEALYLAIQCWRLKKRNAPDREYKKMVNKVAPFMYITLSISVIVLIILWIFK